jgi:hypothetical protein
VPWFGSIDAGLPCAVTLRFLPVSPHQRRDYLIPQAMQAVTARGRAALRRFNGCPAGGGSGRSSERDGRGQGSGGTSGLPAGPGCIPGSRRYWHLAETAGTESPVQAPRRNKRSKRAAVPSSAMLGPGSGTHSFTQCTIGPSRGWACNPLEALSSPQSLIRWTSAFLADMATYQSVRRFKLQCLPH